MTFQSLQSFRNCLQKVLVSHYLHPPSWNGIGTIKSASQPSINCADCVGIITKVDHLDGAILERVCGEECPKSGLERVNYIASTADVGLSLLRPRMQALVHPQPISQLAILNTGRSQRSSESTLV